jgi:hypothetical protein
MSRLGGVQPLGFYRKNAGRMAILALSLAAALAFGNFISLVTIHWGARFILWQLVWWLFVSLASGLVALRIAIPISYTIPDDISEARLNPMVDRNHFLLIVIDCILLSLGLSVWTMTGHSFGKYPILIYWPLTVGVFMLAAFDPTYVRIADIKRRRQRTRELIILEKAERAKRSAELSSVERIEFENQFLLELYQVTAGDMRPVALGDVWARLNHDLTRELTERTVDVWCQRKCIKVGDRFEVDKLSRLSLTVAGRDLCIRAIDLHSMQEALSERLKGYRVMNSFKNAGVVVIGDNAHVHDNVAQFVDATSQVRLDMLAQELADLRRELLKVAASPSRLIIDGVSEAEVGIAIGEVSAAEREAREGKPQSVSGHLAKAGRWVLDVAKEMGISLTVEAIKTAFKHYNIPI